MKSILSFFTKSANSFEGQDKDENVVLLLRSHPFTVLAKLSPFAFLALLPLVLLILFSPFLSLYNLLTLGFFIVSLWYLILWSAIFYLLTLYTLDIWVITDRRVIDSTQRGLFNRVVSELHISRIQDISVVTHGVVQTFFNFGDLEIQTAGSSEKFRFIQIPNPEKVKDQIMKLTSSHNLT